jgi:hypothetical protein
MDFANSLLDATQRDSMSFRSDACHPSPSAATSAGAAGGGGGWGGYVGEAEEGKCWADAKQMLLIPPSERDKEASERAFPLFLVFCASTCLAWHREAIIVVAVAVADVAVAAAVAFGLLWAW